MAITSDHGEGLGEHAEPTHFFLVYDTTMRMPLVLWGPPDLPRGRRVKALARTIDVAPTLLHWAGLPSLSGAQGRPLQELIEGEGGGGGGYTGVLRSGTELIIAAGTSGSSGSRCIIRAAAATNPIVHAAIQV